MLNHDQVNQHSYALCIFMLVCLSVGFNELFVWISSLSYFYIQIIFLSFYHFDQVIYKSTLYCIYKQEFAYASTVPCKSYTVLLWVLSQCKKQIICSFEGDSYEGYNCINLCALYWLLVMTEWWTNVIAIVCCNYD